MDETDRTDDLQLKRVRERDLTDAIDEHLLTLLTPGMVLALQQCLSANETPRTILNWVRQRISIHDPIYSAIEVWLHRVLTTGNGVAPK
jgi:hypothetical protein